MAWVFLIRVLRCLAVPVTTDGLTSHAFRLLTALQGQRAPIHQYYVNIRFTEQPREHNVFCE